MHTTPSQWCDLYYTLIFDLGLEEKGARPALGLESGLEMCVYSCVRICV